MRKVLKYGGSSVATIEQIINIAKYVKELSENGEQIVVVASAMGKTTNKLISLAKEVNHYPNKRELDALLSTGEIQTVTLITMALLNLGVKAKSFTGFQSGFITDDNHSKAFIKELNTEKIEEALNNNIVCVVAGFQGITENGDITTLGRGGSDTTAVAIASKLKCDCEIYTDVESVYTIDPRLYSLAKKLHKISYEEMMEMAIGGAKVLETRCVELAKKYNVNLYLGKTLEKDKTKGTYVMNKNDFEQMPVTNISVKEDISMITINLEKKNENLINEIFKIIEKQNINLDMISKNCINNNVIFSFSSSKEQSEEFVNYIKLNQPSINVSLNDNLCKIVVVGVGMATHSGIASKVFNTLSLNNINYENITTSEISITFTTSFENKQIAIEVLAKEFDL